MPTREANLEFGSADAKMRSVPVTLSTEFEVDRGTHREILSHALNDVDLTREPLPLIESHDTRRLNVGIVENLRLVGKSLKGVARFGSSSRAEEIFRDVLDRVVRHVSVGYELLDNGTRTQNGALRFKWRPYELSAVGVPADPDAQFFRSRRQTMEPNDTVVDEERPSRSQRRAAAHGEELREVGELGERNRISAIDNLCKANKVDEQTRKKWIDSGASIDAIAPEILRILQERSDVSSHTAVGLSKRETRDFSVLRAVRAQVDGKPRDAGLEFEASEALKQKLGMTHRQGLFVPLEVQQRALQLSVERAMLANGRRDLTASVASAGGFLVETVNVGFIETLRNRSVVYAMGARRLSGLQGNVTVPKQTAGATAYWVAEGAAITESQQTFAQMALVPKSVGGLTDVTRKLLLQASPDAEGIVMFDLASIVALAVDKAALHGSGAGAEPLGIAGTAGVGAVAGASIDYAKLRELQTDVADAGVTPMRGGYATTSTVSSLLMGKQRFTSTDSPLWVGNVWDGQVSGFPAMSSPQVNAATMFFGDWQELVIGEWGVLELLANPFDASGFPAGNVRIRAMFDCDIGVRRPGAFSVATSIS